MEHDQRVCPRCGEPAGDYRFCRSCSAHMDSLTGVPMPSAPAADPTYLAAQVAQLEQALAAASKSIGDRIAGEPSAAVQVEPEPLPADPVTGDAATVSLGRTKLPEVARLEDVLTVAPADHGPAAAAPIEPSAHVSAPPADELERGASAEDHAPEPLYVAAQALREAFWFEQASAFKAATREAPQSHLPEASAAEPVRTESVPPPSAHEGTPQPAPEPSTAPASRSRWVVAMWVLALIALVALLTGRSGRRSI